jgi:chorismate synthase
VTRLRILTAGESHGTKMTAIIDGLPAGLALDPRAINSDLIRRQGGYGRGYRSRSIEKDEVTFAGGLRFGETIGSPLCLEVQNLDHESWAGVMDALPVEDRSKADSKSLKRPRPGHADLAGALKYDRTDMRDILERASARNTCVRVAAGGVAKALLRRLGVEVFSIVTKIGGVELSIEESAFVGDAKLVELRDLALQSDVGCPDPATAQKMRDRIDEAKKAGDTVGGSFLVIGTGIPTGWGTYAEWDRRLDGRLAQSVMSIQAVKAVEIGIGARAGEVLGSEAHDEIRFDESARSNGSGGFIRKTNRAGGLEGGITNGAPLVVRGTMKPISTLAKPLESVDMDSKQPSRAAYERSDVCAVPACAVIAEAAVAFTLAEAALETYGGDTIADVVHAHEQLVRRYAFR